MHTLYHIQNKVSVSYVTTKCILEICESVGSGLFLCHNLFMVYLTTMSLFLHYSALMGTQKSLILDTVTCKETVVA